LELGVVELSSVISAAAVGGSTPGRTAPAEPPPADQAAAAMNLDGTSMHDPFLGADQARARDRRRGMILTRRQRSG